LLLITWKLALVLLKSSIYKESSLSTSSSASNSLKKSSFSWSTGPCFYSSFWCIFGNPWIYLGPLMLMSGNFCTDEVLFSRYREEFPSWALLLYYTFFSMSLSFSSCSIIPMLRSSSISSSFWSILNDYFESHLWESSRILFKVMITSLGVVHGRRDTKFL
jgi:hypothetical protein